jgi:hypothetical protein
MPVCFCGAAIHARSAKKKAETEGMNAMKVTKKAGEMQ